MQPLRFTSPRFRNLYPAGSHVVGRPGGGFWPMLFQRPSRPSTGANRRGYSNLKNQEWRALQQMINMAPFESQKLQVHMRKAHQLKEEGETEAARRTFLLLSQRAYGLDREIWSQAMDEYRALQPEEEALSDSEK